MKESATRFVRLFGPGLALGCALMLLWSIAAAASMWFGVSRSDHYAYGLIWKYAVRGDAVAANKAMQEQAPPGSVFHYCLSGGLNPYSGPLRKHPPCSSWAVVPAGSLPGLCNIRGYLNLYSERPPLRTERWSYFYGMSCWFLSKEVDSYPFVIGSIRYGGTAHTTRENRISHADSLPTLGLRP